MVFSCNKLHATRLHFLSLALSVAFKRFKIISYEFKVSVELNLECER